MIRFAVLNIYMVLSPLMFLGWVFPGFMNVTRQYWSGFLSRAFFAPAYILMIYLSYQILVNLKSAGSSASKIGSVFGDKQVDATANFTETIPYFILSVAFLIASIVVAQKMGAQGATSAIAIGRRVSGKARQYAGSATIGTAAAVGRKTVGAAGNAATNNNNRVGRYINSRAQGSGLSAWTARRAQDVSSAAANSSFDVRQVGGLGKATGLGEGKKGGFVKAQADRVKKEQERAKKYAYNDQAYDDYGVRPEFDEYQELQRRRNEAFESLAQTNDIEERQRLSEITRSIQEEIAAMEAGTVSQVERSRLQDPAAIANREAALREFNHARSQANSNYGQRLYAANLRTRYDNVPYVGDVELISRNQTRDAAADAIDRQAGQNPQERMIREFFAQQNPPAATP